VTAHECVPQIYRNTVSIFENRMDIGQATKGAPVEEQRNGGRWEKISEWLFRNCVYFRNRNV
jgi:hypothetical protein